MTTMNPQALELNKAIQATNAHVYNLLSERGKNIYFPKRGILSQSAEARGSSINATIGTALEDDGTPMALASLRQLLNLKKADCFNYAPSPGRPEFRTLWKQMLVKKNPLLAAQEISLPVVTSALTHGISLAGYLFVNPGDQVITSDLYWENYDLALCNAYGASITTFQTFTEQGGFNVNGLAARLNEGTPGKRIVILNFPNNPTGYTVTTDEAVHIRDVLTASANAGNDIVVLVDDAYFGLVFEKGIIEESMFGLLSNAHERICAIKLDGPTKEDYVWGFRVGFLTFGTAKNSAGLYAALESKAAGVVRGNISNCSNLSQELLLAAYNHEGYEQEKTDKYAILKRRYEKLRNLFAAKPEYKPWFTPLPFNSGYFMCIRIKHAEAVRQRLIKNYSTGLIAVNDDILRIAFSATPIEKIELLLENVYNAAKDVAGSQE